MSILATSREPLHLQAEYLLRLDGLTLPNHDDLGDAASCDSVQLFAERAERSNGRPLLNADNLRDIVKICRFVQGSPLGIELAAASSRWLSPAEIYESLQSQFDSLQITTQDVTLRHRSLQAVFDYSWQLLTASEQTALAQLSVFRRGFQSNWRRPKW
jgi:predicted ATPase